MTASKLLAAQLIFCIISFMAGTAPVAAQFHPLMPEIKQEEEGRLTIIVSSFKRMLRKHYQELYNGDAAYR